MAQQSPVVDLANALKANPQAAAISSGRNARIVGGKRVDIDKNPWQVALVRGLVAEPTRSQFCGGSLVANNWVLSAAHCVRNSIVREEPARINVVAGTGQYFIGGERLQVAAIQVHPQNNPSTQDFDYALLRLTRPATIGATVKSIDPAGANTQVADGSKVRVTGWGATTEGGPGSLELLGVEIPVVSNSVCNEAYNGDITTSMMCAGEDEGGKDSCQGDSGGPLTIPADRPTTLIGVVSWGEGCARSGKYGIYARVPVAAQWIASTMGRN
jgi:transmembrane serine protease 11D